MSISDYDSNIMEDPLTEADRRQRLRDIRREQARTLREKLGDDLYDWLDDFFDDFDFLTGETDE